MKIKIYQKEVKDHKRAIKCSVCGKYRISLIVEDGIFICSECNAKETLKDLSNTILGDIDRKLHEIEYNINKNLIKKQKY